MSRHSNFLADFHSRFVQLKKHSTFNIQRSTLNQLIAAVLFALMSTTAPAQTNGMAPTDVLAHSRENPNKPANLKLPSLFLIGDSTVRNGQGRGDGGQWGWGDYLAPFFDTNQINVVNRAMGGTSSRTYYRDQWPKAVAMIKPGDFVIMQLGHNDSGALNDTSRARGTIKGAGDEMEVITNLITKKVEEVHSFGWYEKQMIIEAGAKGAMPMVCSLIPRNTWKGGLSVRNKKDYAGWAGEAAAAENAPFLDINEIICRQYDQLGQEAVKALFIVGAGPHTSLAGAQTNAACVISALKGLSSDPLAKYFSAKADGVPAADLSQPPPAAAAAAANVMAEDERPVVDASTVPVEKMQNTGLPTFHIVGDSTVRSGGTGVGLWGWGERIKPYFDTNKVTLVNHAIGGRSARTYYTEGRWQKVANVIKPGDFVIIQFGHNDQGRIDDPANKHRPDGRGIGDEAVNDLMPDGTNQVVHTFGWYMSHFAADAKQRGATVVICSPIPHKQHWEHERDFADLTDWDNEVAEKDGVLFFDLTMVITDAYKKVGADKVETFFADKGTHTTDTGAQFNAACVIAGLKSLPGNPLGDFLSDKAKDIQPYQPSVESTATNAPVSNP